MVEWDWYSQGRAVMRKIYALDDPLLLYAGHDPRKEVTLGHRTLRVRLDPTIPLKMK